MSLKKSLTVLGFVVLFIGKAYPYDNLGSSAIATGMGGAYVATANDPSGIFYNPAGLAQITQYTFYGMYNRQTAFGYFLNENPYSLAGAGVLPFSQGVLGLGISQNGSWSKETQVVTHNTVAVSFARFLSPQVSLGANAKFLFNTNYGDKTGADIDLGLMYFPTPRLTLGLVGENLAGTDVLPDNLGTYYFYNRRQFKAGLAYELMNGEYRTRFGFDTIFKQKKGSVDQVNNLNNFGIQQSIPTGPASAVSFRAGYSLGKDYSQDFNSLAFGVSYEFKSGQNSYRFDYSYQDYPFESYEDLAGDNRFALTIAFGAPRTNNNGYAQHREKLELASRAKASFKQRKSEQDIWEAPAEIKREERLTPEMNKTSAQVKVPEPVQREYLPATPPENVKNNPQNLITGFKVSSKVETVQSKHKKDKSYMFIFKYNLDEKESQVSEWRIIIATRPSSIYLVQETDQDALRVIKGKGIPPSVIVWDGKGQNGVRLNPGKYSYAMLLYTWQGGKFLSNWSQLTTE